jgi:membrane-associated phospholipid phosphatase
LYEALGAHTFVLKLVGLVAFGRVFYHCHFFGDTIIGALMGYAVATCFFAFEIMLPTPDFF